MNRRHFVHQAALGAFGLPALFRGFPRNLQQWLPPALTETDHVLVIVQLYGGNDGLNTVIPLDRYDLYRNARPQVYIPEQRILNLNGAGHMGLHPSLEGLQRLYKEDALHIVQSVGYPQPNFSHFRATDIWMTGADSNQLLNTGWLGRYLKYEYPAYPVDFPNEVMPDPLAMEIGSASTLTFQGPLSGMSMAVANPTEIYEMVEGIETPAPDTPAGDQLRYIRLIKKQTNRYRESINKAYRLGGQQIDYPTDNYLAEQLKIVAKLISGGLKTKVYMVSLDGFDTHDSQVEGGDHTEGEHARLLRMLGDALSTFVTDCRKLGIQDRVVGLTVSEFGRRITSNASNGTDHGAAAPLFLFGDPVKGGISGVNPDIPPNPTEENNIPMQYDFRSVYATMLQDWLCVASSDLQETLLREYPTLPLLENVACLSTSVHQDHIQAGKTYIRAYPNPFVQKTTLELDISGGYTTVQIMDGTGKVIAVPLKGNIPNGLRRMDWDSGDLPPGVYYARLQSGAIQQVNQMLKVR